VVRCAEETIAEHREWAANSVAGLGLRDRAVIVEDAGKSSLSSAEILEKIGEATEATLRKVELAGGSDGTQGVSRGATRGGGEDGNLLRLGVRLLSESLTRIAAVARRSADEAIAGVGKALELSRSMAQLDVEARRARERKAARQQRGFAEDDEPVAAPDAEEAEDSELGGRGGKSGAGAAGGAAAGSQGDAARSPHGRAETPDPKTLSTPRDLKAAALRVKERHVALRVKNLRFLSSLNEEALRSRTRLRSLMERSEGALLPEVSVSQKQRLFDLVEQMLDFGLAESTRLAANPAASAARVLDRSLAFALALEHGESIAMPVDSRTQALKLAAMVDTDLLAQVVDGPFRRRLMAAGPKRRAVPVDGVAGFPQAYGRGVRASPPGFPAAAAAGARAWEEAADACCRRIAKGVRRCLEPGTEPSAPEEGAVAGGKGSAAATPGAASAAAMP
jgi:hypothetical protein